MNLFANGAELIRKRLRACCQVEVTYRRKGSASALSLAATTGSTAFRTESDSNSRVSVVWRSADFIVDALPFVPQRGDVIIYDGRSYEVLAPAGEPCFRFSDPGRTIMRIHTYEAQG